MNRKKWLKGHYTYPWKMTLPLSFTGSSEKPGPGKSLFSSKGNIYHWWKHDARSANFQISVPFNPAMMALSSHGIQHIPGIKLVSACIILATQKPSRGCQMSRFFRTTGRSSPWPAFHNLLGKPQITGSPRNILNKGRPKFLPRWQVWGRWANIQPRPQAPT